MGEQGTAIARHSSQPGRYLSLADAGGLAEIENGELPVPPAFAGEEHLPLPIDEWARQNAERDCLRRPL